MLSGKTVLITGGTTGVGRATAMLLAEQGCRMFLCGRDRGHLTDALETVRSQGGTVAGLATDLSTAENIEALFAAADDFLGNLDIGIFNAGVGAKGELAEMRHAEYRYVIDVNLSSYIGCSLEAMRRMRSKGGHLVLIGSMSADICEERSAVYVATKAGIRGFAASLRKEANPAGVKISVIEPGSIGSDMVDETPDQQSEMRAQLKMLRAEDVAQAILYTLSQPAWCDVVKMQIRPHLQLI